MVNRRSGKVSLSCTGEEQIKSAISFIHSYVELNKIMRRYLPFLPSSPFLHNPTHRPPTSLHPSRPTSLQTHAYNSAQATIPASTPPPKPGIIATAAPVLSLGPAEPVGVGAESAFWTGPPATPVPFLHSSSLSSAAEALNVISAHYTPDTSAHCNAIQAIQPHLPFPSPPISQTNSHSTHIIKTRAGMTNLNNLDTSLHPVQALNANITLSQPLLERRAPRLLQAQHALARLVEVIHEADVEVGHVGAEAEVHVGQGPGVRAVDDEAAAGERPLRAVGDVGGFGDVGACGVGG